MSHNLTMMQHVLTKMMHSSYTGDTIDGSSDVCALAQLNTVSGDKHLLEQFATFGNLVGLARGTKTPHSL